MKVPIEISFHDAEVDGRLEAVIREKAEGLERFYDRMTSCRVVVEHPHEAPKSGSGWRVRLDITVPGHEVVIRREPGEGSVSDDAETVVRQAFDAARKRLKKLSDVQNRDVKKHPEQEVRGFVTKLFDDYGFIEPTTGGEVYFHRNSVVGADFDDLETGTGVTWTEEAGEKGPQASSVRVVE